MNREEEIKILDEVNKGACMGMDAIKVILEKVKDEALEKELNRQYREYKKTVEKIEEIYPTNLKEPHETNAMNKVMTWYGIEMRTFMDDSTSKIAEILLQGTNMGIIEGRRLLNNNDTHDEVNDILEDFVEMQEEAVEKLKEFL